MIQSKLLLFLFVIVILKLDIFKFWGFEKLALAFEMQNPAQVNLHGQLFKNT